jgi:hypothetical protein
VVSRRITKTVKNTLTPFNGVKIGTSPTGMLLIQ